MVTDKVVYGVHYSNAISLVEVTFFKVDKESIIQTIYVKHCSGDKQLEDQITYNKSALFGIKHGSTAKVPEYLVNNQSNVVFTSTPLATNRNKFASGYAEVLYLASLKASKQVRDLINNEILYTPDSCQLQVRPIWAQKAIAIVSAIMATGFDYSSGHENLIPAQAVITFGEQHQIQKAIGECGELISELVKMYTDGKSNLDDVAQEVADVEIMMSQLRLIVGYDRVEMAKLSKLNRLEGILSGH